MGCGPERLVGYCRILCRGVSEDVGRLRRRAIRVAVHNHEVLASVPDFFLRVTVTRGVFRLGLQSLV